MALLSLGSNATTTLSALQFLAGMNVADRAALAALILNDGASPNGQPANAAPAAKPILPNAFTTDGHLYVPNRGVLQVLPGDYVAVDANGWPILLSANAITGGSSPSATTSWTHT